MKEAGRVPRTHEEKVTKDFTHYWKKTKGRDLSYLPKRYTPDGTHRSQGQGDEPFACENPDVHGDSTVPPKTKAPPVPAEVRVHPPRVPESCRGSRGVCLRPGAPWTGPSADYSGPSPGQEGVSGVGRVLAQERRLRTPNQNETAEGTWRCLPDPRTQPLGYG